MTTEPTPLVTVLPCEAESDAALAQRMRSLLVEVSSYWGFAIPDGPLDGMSAAALEAIVRAVKEEREAIAIRTLSNKGGRDGE